MFVKIKFFVLLAAFGCNAEVPYKEPMACRDGVAIGIDCEPVCYIDSVLVEPICDLDGTMPYCSDGSSVWCY